MMHLAFELFTAIAALHTLVSCSERFQGVAYLRPFLLNTHPVVVSHGGVSLTDITFKLLHAEVSSLLIYDYRRLQLDSANKKTVQNSKRFPSLKNVTGRYFDKFIWKKLPSFIHTFPMEPMEEVYSCQYQFLTNSGLGFTTRPRIYSVILTNKISLIHQGAPKGYPWAFFVKQLFESTVDYFDFAVQLDLVDAECLKFVQYTDVHSVSLLKFCGMFCTPKTKVSLHLVESCNPSKGISCLERALETVSDEKLNLSKFAIEIDSLNTINHKTSDTCFPGELIKQSFKISSNFSNYFVQDLLANQLFKGFPVLDQCKSKESEGLIYIKISFAPVYETDTGSPTSFDSGSFISLLNAESFTFLTCDGMKSEIGFTGYLEPFDANTWLLTLLSLLVYSFIMSIKLYNVGNIKFLDCFLSPICMNFSYLTGVSNIHLDSLLRDAPRISLTVPRILMIFWMIGSFILCSLYSSLVTSNVIAPKKMNSSWTDYKQLMRFSKVFAVENEKDWSVVDRAYKSDNTVLRNREDLMYGSKVSKLWYLEYKSMVFNTSDKKTSCSVRFKSGNPIWCEAYYKELLQFLDSYRLVRRGEVSEIQKILSVCTKTAYFDTVDSIDRFKLLMEAQGESLPQLAKGNPFYEQRFFWAVKYTWVFRRILEFRLKAFTVSGIIQFWESFCKKYCKQQTGKINTNQVPTISNPKSFKPQGLQSNLMSLFYAIFILLSASSLCFLLEIYLKLCLDS
jgi:hypothetical protein